MKTDPFSIRLPPEQQKRILQIIAATGQNYSKSEIISIALDVLFALLPATPSMLPGYDISKDVAVTQRRSA